MLNAERRLTAHHQDRKETKITKPNSFGFVVFVTLVILVMSRLPPQ
jgi:hypothetical protein